MTRIQATTPAGIVRRALAHAEVSAGKASLNAGLSRSALAVAFRTMRADGAATWLGRILGGRWVCVQGDGWAVAMTEGEARRVLGVSESAPETLPRCSPLPRAVDSTRPRGGDRS